MPVAGKRLRERTITLWFRAWQKLSLRYGELTTSIGLNFVHIKDGPGPIENYRLDWAPVLTAVFYQLRIVAFLALNHG